MQVKSLKIISLLIAPLLLAACVKHEYPLSVKNDLLSMCMAGIMSGQTQVIDKKHKQENVSKNMELYEFRLANFIKDVDYEDYQLYQLNLYQSYERAFRQKYVLSDVCNNLSDNDQKVFASISKIMLGLGAKDE